MSDPGPVKPARVAAYPLRAAIADALRNTLAFGAILGALGWMHLANLTAGQPPSATTQQTASTSP